MYSPEDTAPTSWTKAAEGGMSPEDQESDLENRHGAAQEYVDYYLEGAGDGLESAAMSLINAVQSDLENPNYIAALKEGLSDADAGRLDEFIDQLKADRGWGDGAAEEAADAPNVTEEATASAATETAPAEAAAEAEPVVYESKEAAAEALRENAEAMAADLAALEAVEDDPYQTLQNFFAVLDSYAVDIQSTSRESDVIRGIPVTMYDSAIPETEYDDWGGQPDRATSGSISGLKRSLTIDKVMKDGFSAEEATNGFVHPAIIDTLNRLFAK
tara:strand:- start:4853 stop:5671 length:819 start_codon:yes stop_codon:yes gene_type:complete